MSNDAGDGYTAFKRDLTAGLQVAVSLPNALSTRVKGARSVVSQPSSRPSDSPWSTLANRCHAAGPVLDSPIRKNRVHPLLRFLMTLNRVADWTGHLIAPLTFVMMLLTCVVVMARYVLNIGLIPITELILYIHASIFMLGIAYTLRADAHVRVDIIYQRLSQRGQAIIDLLGAIVFLLPLSLFIFVTSLDYVSLSWQLQEGSAEPGGLPGIYLMKGLIPLMAGLLGIQGIAEIARLIQTLVAPPPPRVSNIDG